MTHGDKAKGKTAQAASKASGKSDKAGSQKSSAKAETGKGGKGAEQARDSKTSKGGSKAPAKAAVAKKADAEAKGGNGKAVPRLPDGGFTNPVVGNAFKRALKKYPNAFRRLTD